MEEEKDYTGLRIQNLQVRYVRTGTLGQIYIYIYTMYTMYSVSIEVKGVCVLTWVFYLDEIISNTLNFHIFRYAARHVTVFCECLSLCSDVFILQK